MKAVALKKLQFLTLGLFFGVASSVMFLGTAYADTKPYFKITGGDVFAGGWFNQLTTCQTSTSSNYQAPDTYPVTAANQYQGAIMGYANTSGSRQGSAVDFGAFALGDIEGNPASTYGFYSGIAGTSYTSFSNTNSRGASSFWGGTFEGGLSRSHCIPDYYGTMQGASVKTIASPNGPNSALNYAQEQGPLGNYKTDTGGTVAIIDQRGAVTINAGQNIALFVKGNVYIDHNITYGPHDANHVPKFVMVVQGNIYVNWRVTQLDGWYVAQPAATANPVTDNTGVFWSCHLADNNPVTDTWVRQNCLDRQLTINGAVTAKQVNLTRILGDVNDNNTVPAEKFNYIPEMVIGGPFFNVTSQPSTGFQSLISLPPVF